MANIRPSRDCQVPRNLSAHLTDITISSSLKTLKDSSSIILVDDESSREL